MQIVIFEKETKRIVLILPKDDPARVAFGFSDNCAKATVENAPTGLYFDGEPDPPDPEPETEVVTEQETETEEAGTEEEPEPETKPETDEENEEDTEE